MSRVIICPRTMGSNSAKVLAKALKTKKVYKDRRFKARPTDVLVNWGNASPITVFGENYLNKNTAVDISSNKVKSFEKMRSMGVRIPAFATTKEEASALFEETGKIYCRTLTRASEGRGIVIAENTSELVNAGLYTAQVPVTNEYRIHVFKGTIIDVAEKRKMSEERLADANITEVNSDVRSHLNGWVFVHGSARLKHTDVVYKQDLATQAIKAVEAMGLDFGAVDIVYNNSGRNAYVIEVNSAPGMEEGTTTHFNYTKAFRGLVDPNALTVEDYNTEYESEVSVAENIINFISNTRTNGNRNAQ